MNVKNKFTAKFGTVLLVAVIALAAMTGGVSAQEVDTGDIEVTLTDNDTVVGTENVTLMDASDDTEVEVLETDTEGVAVYTAVEYGEYYLTYTDGSNVTTESSNFTHENSDTFAVFDADSNSLTINVDEESYLENVEKQITDNVVTGTPSNVDEAEGWGYVGVVIGTAITAIVVGSGILLAIFFRDMVFGMIRRLF